MTTADLLNEIKEDINEVYEAGYQSFWDALTNNNNITADCRYLFYGEYWTDKAFKPPYAIKPNKNNNRYMFQESNITKVSTKQIDFSEATTLRQTFVQSNVEEVEMVVDKATLNATFDGVDTLKKLDLTVSDSTNYSNAFNGCSGLTDLTINGTISKAGFDLTDCVYLSVESIKSVLEACNKENANITITLPYYCIDGKTITADICFTQLPNEYNAANANGYLISWT